MHSVVKVMVVPLPGIIYKLLIAKVSYLSALHHQKIFWMQTLSILHIGLVSPDNTPVVGILDVGNLTPHSYLFLPPRQEQSDLFVQRLKYLIERAKL